MIQKLKTLIIALSLVVGLYTILTPQTAQALEPCKEGYAHPLDASGNPLEGCSKKITPKEAKTVCPSGKAGLKINDKTDTTKCQPLGNTCDQKTGVCSDNPIVATLNTIVKFLSGLVGVVIVGVIIFGGIQYALAGDKAEAVTAAKKRIANGVIALFVFLFIFAFVQWLIPGGVF